MYCEVLCIEVSGISLLLWLAYYSIWVFDDRWICIFCKFMATVHISEHLLASAVFVLTMAASS